MCIVAIVSLFAVTAHTFAFGIDAVTARTLGAVGLFPYISTSLYQSLSIHIYVSYISFFSHTHTEVFCELIRAYLSIIICSALKRESRLFSTHIYVSFLMHIEVSFRTHKQRHCVWHIRANLLSCIYVSFERLFPYIKRVLWHIRAYLSIRVEHIVCVCMCVCVCV